MASTGRILTLPLATWPHPTAAACPQLEANIAAAGTVTSMLQEGASARDITERLLAGLGVSDTGFTLTPR